MSKMLEAALEMANDLHDVGAIDEITMRKIKALCLPERKEFTAEDIVRLRQTNHVSQGVFAACLGLGKSTVQQWEQGKKKPSGAAARLLLLVERKGLQALC